MPGIPEGLAAALADRYRLERELGSGGMATVYLAEDLKHHRQVAIKVLRPDLAASLGAERFLREVGIAARLSHPHILGLFDSGETAGFLYYVMPYVEGISLRQKLQREGELPIPEAVRILRDIADALALAHRQGVVHRDIKPENVMLVERHALVMDFGVAKALAEGKEEGTSSLTSAGVALGTPAYMAPEQASGEGHVDHRADLYAWGVVAYELLAGQPPFVRATPQNTLAAQVTATPEPVSHHRANVPGALARLVMQCLEKKPADRPQTAEDVLRQLDQVLTPSGGMTPTDTRPYLSAGMRRAKRRQLMMGAAVVAGLAVISALGWRWWQNRGVPIVADRVVIAPFRNETGKPELADLGWRLAEQVGGAVSREGVTESVALATVRERLGSEGAQTTSALQRLGRATGAGLVVSGTYRARGDSVEIRTEILRMPAGTRVYDLTPVVGRSADATLLDRAAEQATLALLLNKDWGDDFRWGQDYRMPASLAAYREYVKGREFGWQYDADWHAQRPTDANAAFERALALDPMWPYQRIERLWRLSGPQRDTALAKELTATTEYLPGDRDELEVISATQDRNREWKYQAVKRRYLRSPAEYRYAMVEVAEVTRRWHEAVRAGAGRHEPDFQARHTGEQPDPWAQTHLMLLYSLHALGQHDSVLQLAREMRAEGARYLVWAITGEILSHAALGHTETVDSLVAEAVAVFGPYERDNVAWRELQFHGYADAARAVCSRLADRLIAITGDRTRLWEALHCAGREEEARALESGLVEAAGRESAGGLVFRGLRAAWSGDRDSAYAIVGRLQQLYRQLPRSEAGYNALAVLCALGDTARAVAQFQRNWQGGDEELHSEWVWHRSWEFALIRSHPAVLALMRPKD